MFHKILLITVIGFFIGLGILFSHLSKTEDTFKLYQRYGFVKSDVHYEKVEKKWGQQGLIFYQLEFLNLKVPHHVEKMALSMDDSGLKAHLTNVRLNVNKAMQKLYASETAQALNDYVPYRDFFDRILTSLAVMGVDEFVGDILVNTTYSDLKTMDFEIQVNQNKKSALKMSGVIHLPLVGTHQISDLWQGQMKKLDIKIENKNQLNQYINYAKSRKIKAPETLKNGIISLKNLSKKLPKLSDIMR